MFLNYELDSWYFNLPKPEEALQSIYFFGGGVIDQESTLGQN